MTKIVLSENSIRIVLDREIDYDIICQIGNDCWAVD